jgi:hypothetical protein
MFLFTVFLLLATLIVLTFSLDMDCAMDIACTDEQALAFLSPRHCIVDIVVNSLVSNHATLQVEEATLVDGKK